MAKATDDLSKYGLKEVTVRLKLDKSDPRMPDMLVDSPYAATIFARRLMSDLDREYTMVVNLNNKMKPINYNIISIGDLTTAQVPMMNVFKTSILSNAYGFMFFHNHPSGDTTPSEEDVEMTKQMIEAGRLMRIPLFDHIIIAGKNRDYLNQSYFSFRENYKELFSVDKAIDLAYIRSFSHGMTKAERVGEQNRTFHTERGQRMDLKGQRKAIFSATIQSKDAWCKYLKSASYFVCYHLLSAMQIVDRFPDGVAVADKETWEKIGFRVRPEETGLTILQNRNHKEFEKTVFDLSQIEDPKNFVDTFLWSLKGIHAKDLYRTLSKDYPEIDQDGMTPSMAVQILVRNEFEKTASERSDLKSGTILSLEHFVTASVTYSILSRMFKDTDRKIFFPVSDQQFSELKEKNLLEPAMQLFYRVEGSVSGKISDSVKVIRKEMKERSKDYGKSEKELLRGHASAVGIRTEKGNLAQEKPSGSDKGIGGSRGREDSVVLSSVSVGLQRSGASLHGEDEGIAEGRNAKSTDAERPMGNVDAGITDRGEELRGSRDGLQTVTSEDHVSESDTKAEQESSVSESDTKAEQENPVSESDTKAELENPVSETDTKLNPENSVSEPDTEIADRYEIHDMFRDPYQNFRFMTSDPVPPMSEEEKEGIQSEDWTNHLEDHHQSGILPVQAPKENTIVPTEWADVCDAALRDNPLEWNHGPQELVTELSVAVTQGNHNITEIVKRNLGTEYGSGLRFHTPDGKTKDYCSWFTEEGIILAKGRNVRTSSERILVSWDDAASRIVELLLSGQYLPDSEMEQMRNKYLRDAAESLALTYRDIPGDSHDIFEKNVLKMSGADEFSNGFPDRTNLLMYLLKDPDGAGKLNDLARYFYDFVGTTFSSKSLMLRNFKDKILPKFDLIEQPYCSFPKTGFTYEHRPEIYISDEELEHDFRQMPSHYKLSILQTFKKSNDLTPAKVLHKIYGSYSGSSVGSRYFYTAQSSNITLEKTDIVGQENARITVSFDKAGQIMEDMQNHHRFLLKKDIEEEPLFVSDGLSGEIIRIFSKEKKLGSLIIYSERILGRKTVDENDWSASANLQMILSREILSNSSEQNSDVFSGLYNELQLLSEGASKETKEEIHKAINHLQAFMRHDLHPFGNLTDSMIYDPSRLPSVVQRETEDDSKSIGLASEDSPEPEQMSFFSFLDQQSKENLVSETDTKAEPEDPVSETDTKIEPEDSDTEIPYVLSYPDPEEMPSRNPAVKNVVDEMATHLQGKELSYLTFFLPENRFYLEIMRGNNNLLSSEETESGMMQWDVTSFHDNFSDKNRIHAMALKTEAQEKLRPEDLLYTAMYGLGLLDSSYRVVNHFYGNPYSVGEMENGNQIVFRFDQDRTDDIWRASRFSDFNPDDGSYPTLAELTSVGRIVWFNTHITDAERKEIEEKASSFRRDFLEKFKNLSPEQKYESVRRMASPDIQLAMLHDKEEGLGVDQVADRYFNFALYKEGDRPKPYRKEPEKLVENVKNVIEKASDTPDRKRPVLSLGPQHSCYQMFYYLFPDLLNKESDTN